MGNAGITDDRNKAKEKVCFYMYLRSEIVDLSLEVAVGMFKETRYSVFL